jgi:hypothetical protein
MANKRVDHEFTFPELAYGSKVNYQPGIRLSFFFKKLPHVSYEQFMEHYHHVHADLTVATKSFNVYQIQKYVQTYQPPELKDKLKSLGLQVLDFDACSQMWVKSWDDWEKFSSSEEYLKALVPDGVNFMDVASITVMAGHDTIIFGKASPDVGATDGITRAPEAP